MQGGQARVAGGFGLAVQPGQQVGAPLGEVRDPRRHPVRVQAQPQHVDRRLEQLRADVAGEQRDAGVRVDQLPPAVHHRGRVGLVAVQDAFQRVADGLELGLGQAAFGVGGREAAGQQQRVAVAQRHVEVLGQVQDHLAGRPGPAGLDEAQVPGGDVRRDGEVELAEPAALPPLADQVTGVHLGEPSRVSSVFTLPRR